MKLQDFETWTVARAMELKHVALSSHGGSKVIKAIAIEKENEFSADVYLWDKEGICQSHKYSFETDEELDNLVDLIWDCTEFAMNIDDFFQVPDFNLNEIERKYFD